MWRKQRRPTRSYAVITLDVENTFSAFGLAGHKTEVVLIIKRRKQTSVKIRIGEHGYTFNHGSPRKSPI